MKTYSKFMEESYTLYHPSYTSAINAALQKHSDLNVSPEDRDTHIAMGPRKPAEGETVKHHIPATDKNGDKHMIHIQVYNKGGNKPFELNTYSSKKGVSFSSVSKKKVAEETIDVSEGLGDRYTNDPIGNFSGLKAHAKKLGSKHKDYDDLMVAASHMAFGNSAHLKKHLNAMDTDVRDKIKEYMKEEAEHIDELSKKTLGSYVKKAEYQKNALIGFGMIDAIHHSGKNERKIMNKFKNRAYGIDKAANKLSGQAKVNANEEADQIDELKHSGGVLNNYLSKTNPDRNTPEENKKRAAGRGLALGKKWGKALGINQPKVSATNEEIDLEEADLTKIDTKTLQTLTQLHKHYGQKDPRAKASSERGEAELKRREDSKKTNEESDYIGYNFGGQFKDSSEWENAAKKRGLVVKLSTHPSGEVIKYQIAKDKSGNNRGHFDHGTKSGRLTIDEALGTIKNMKAASKFNSNNVSDMLRGEKARKAGMAKVSTTKDIGYRVVDVGPGQKETVRSERNFKEEVELDENWNEGVSSTNSNLHKNAGRESENKAKIAKIKAGRYAKDSEGYNKLMSQHHTLKAKSIKHFYHAGMYGSKDSAKKDHDEQIKYSKEYKSNSVKEEAQRVYEEHMSEKDAESLAQRHVDAAISAKKSGNLAGYYAHAEASNYIRDKILTHTYSPKGIPSVKIRSTAKKLFRESDLAEKEEAELNEISAALAMRASRLAMDE